MCYYGLVRCSLHLGGITQNDIWIYFIMVIMLPSGDIDSRAVDWFEDPYECVEMFF